MNNIRKRKKSKLTNSDLSIKNKNCKFFSCIHKIVIKTYLIVPKKISIIKRNKDTNKENIKSFYRELDFYDLIILLLITSIFNLSYQNSLIFTDSYITLKVSGGDSQKIFGDGTDFTKPDEVWIDINNIPVVNSLNNLSPTNIIKLVWKNDITECQFMFKGCDEITEINFTHFDAKKCTSTDNMFRECYSLKSLDLSGFFTSNKLNYMADMFWDCKSLISADFSNFDTSQVTNFGHMFCNCESLEWINFSNVINDKTTKLDYIFYGCNKLTSVNLSNFYTTNLDNINNMFNGCESLKIINFPNLYITNINEEFLIEIFKNCPKLEYLNIQNFDSNSAKLNLVFQDIPNNLIICINKAEFIEEIINHDCNLISCKGNSPNFYYKLNKENQCFTENCSSTNYKYEFQGACYEECPENTKERKNVEESNVIFPCDNYFCKPICNETFPFEILNKQECVKNCDISSIINELCILNYKKAENTSIYDSLLKNVEDLFISEDYDTSEIENGNNDVITYKEMIVTLTSINNQKADENKGNISSINIGECEELLKKAYNISSDETLFMKKIDVKEEGMKIPKIEYDVYYKLNGRNLVKLNLSYCYNVKIDISIPLKINEDLDKYNSNSRYYNDICYTTTSEDGTDILLTDRQKEFIDNNKTICQENCILSEYNYYINKAKCSCDVAESSTKFNDIKIDKSKLYKNFINYSMILIIITHFKFELLKLSTKKNKFKLCFNKTKSRRKSKNKTKLKKDKESNPPIKKSRKINMKLKYQIEETSQSFKKISLYKNKSKSIKKDKKHKHEKNNISYNDEELNNLEYILAIRYDKRNYCKFYF